MWFSRTAEVPDLACTYYYLTDSRVQRSRKTFRKSNFLAWAKGRWGQDGVSSRRKKYRVFGAPLDTIIINDQLPEILQVGFEFSFFLYPFCLYVCYECTCAYVHTSPHQLSWWGLVLASWWGLVSAELILHSRWSYTYVKFVSDHCQMYTLLLHWEPVDSKHICR